MIEINVNNEPYNDETIHEYFTTTASFKSNLDSNTDDLVCMLLKAFELDGYCKASVLKSIKEAAKMLEEDIKLNNKSIEENK